MSDMTRGHGRPPWGLIPSSLPDLVTEWLKGCSNSDPRAPWRCEECTEAFAAAVRRRLEFEALPSPADSMTPGQQPSGVTRYCVHCPHCRAEHTMLDATLWPGTFLGRSGEAEYPGDPSEPQRCPNCSRWMQIILIGKDHELTVEKCEAPQADPPEILGTGL